MDTTKLPKTDSDGLDKTAQVIRAIYEARWHALKLDQVMTLEQYIAKCQEKKEK